MFVNINSFERSNESHPLPVCDPSTESGVSGVGWGGVGGGEVTEVPMPVSMFGGDSRGVHLEDFRSRNVRVDLLPSVKPSTGNRINICKFLFHETSPCLEFTGCEQIHTHMDARMHARTHARTHAHTPKGE